MIFSALYGKHAFINITSLPSAEQYFFKLNMDQYKHICLSCNPIMFIAGVHFSLTLSELFVTITHQELTQ